MTGRHVVVEFPTGWPLARARRRGNSVAELARRLAVAARVRGRRPKACPLSIELHELAGVADGTIETLAALADDRTITPSCAARLAIRHAREICGPPGGHCDPHGIRRHEMLLAVGESGRFAFRITDDPIGAWVAYGPLSELDLLRRICPLAAGSIYLMPGADGEGRPICRVGTPRHWLPALRRHVRAREDGNDRIVLIVGGLPTRGIRRASILNAIAKGIRRGGVRPVARRHVSDPCGGPIVGPCEGDSRHLLLIDLAFPGLVEREGERR